MARLHSTSRDGPATAPLPRSWRAPAAREDRAALYAKLGLTLRYDPTRQQIKATAELSRVARGFGGPTRNLGPRPLEADSGWSELRQVA